MSEEFDGSQSLAALEQHESTMVTRDSTWSIFRGLLRMQVLAICLVAFLADVMAGILTATFSLFAESLGASVVFIGVLASLSGLSGLVSSVPIGVFSDQVGRGKVLAFGVGSFGLSMFLMALAPSPAFLIPGRLLLGVAMVGSFWIAAAYLGDIVTTSERGLAYGLLTTAMGLGFAVGPLLGGSLADSLGTDAVYLVAAGVGLIAVLIVQLALRTGENPRTSTAKPLPLLRTSLRVGRDWTLIAVGIGNILSAIAFGGAVSTILPLRADVLGISAATIGSMFAFRAIASTIVRLPSGAFTNVVGTRFVVLVALAIEMIAVIGIGASTHHGFMFVWMIVEGIGYGAFLVGAQSHIAENTVAATRGAAIGFYSMTGGIGNTLSPVLLGAIGAAVGLAAVFYVSGILVAMGLCVMWWIWFVKSDLSHTTTWSEDNHAGVV